MAGRHASVRSPGCCRPPGVLTRLAHLARRQRSWRCFSVLNSDEALRAILSYGCQSWHWGTMLPMSNDEPTDDDVRMLVHRMWVRRDLRLGESGALLRRFTPEQVELFEELTSPYAQAHETKTLELKSRWYVSDQAAELRAELREYTTDETMLTQLVEDASLTGAYCMESGQFPPVQSWAQSLWLMRGEFDLATTLEFGEIERNFQVRDKNGTI